jgi:hypothetical protein
VINSLNSSSHFAGEGEADTAAFSANRKTPGDAVLPGAIHSAGTTGRTSQSKLAGRAQPLMVSPQNPSQYSTADREKWTMKDRESLHQDPPYQAAIDAEVVDSVLSDVTTNWLRHLKSRTQYLPSTSTTVTRF